MTYDEMRQLVEACEYKPGWAIEFHHDGWRPYIQVSATTLDSLTLEPAGWKSGKTWLSGHMCRQEVVAAVFGAIERAEMHEVREFFRYKGAAIFNPHLDPDALASMASKARSFCMRDNPMTMEES